MGYGNIILLNGTSSSEITSILQALQDILEEPYLNAGIDKFIWMLPKRYLEKPLWDDVLGLADQGGATGHLLFHGMHQADPRGRRPTSRRPRRRRSGRSGSGSERKTGWAA